MHIMYAYIKKNYTLNLVAPATVAHAYPLLPGLSLEQPNMEIFVGLTGMVVLVQVTVVFFYSTNKKV